MKACGPNCFKVWPSWVASLSWKGCNSPQKPDWDILIEFHLCLNPRSFVVCFCLKWQTTLSLDLILISFRRLKVNNTDKCTGKRSDQLSFSMLVFLISCITCSLWTSQICESLLCLNIDLNTPNINSPVFVCLTHYSKKFLILMSRCKVLSLYHMSRCVMEKMKAHNFHYKASCLGSFDKIWGGVLWTCKRTSN